VVPDLRGSLAGKDAIKLWRPWAEKVEGEMLPCGHFIPEEQPQAVVVIDYKTQRFEDHARDLDMVFDLIDGETRERSWKLLKRGGTLVSTLTEPSQDKATEFGVRALRYTVEADGNELAEIASLVTAGKVKPHVEKTYPLDQAPRTLAAVEKNHPVGKIVLTAN
jgi:NADPH:quinone reductase-like Zn-dependent oxidoreductase